MSCKVCDFLASLSDEELLMATKCVGDVVEQRWPGATVTLDGDTATEADIAEAYSRSVNAIPKHLHKLLANRPQ